MDLSENIAEDLKKRARQENWPKLFREGSHSGSRDYAALTLPLIESIYLDHLRLLEQSPYIKRNQYHSSSTIETPNTQSSQEDQENAM